MSQEAATGPLRGIKVVEVAAWAAGPMAGGILADWGADVIKIEPPDGDPYRALNIQPGRRPEGMINHNFFVANRNKRSISIDLKNEHGRKLADKLIAQNTRISTTSGSAGPQDGSAPIGGSRAHRW